MSKELANPFNTLIGAAESADPKPPAVAATTATMPPTTNTPSAAAAAATALDRQINAHIQQVFAITVSRSPVPPAHQPLVYMEEIVELCALQPPLLSLDVLDQALFERILLPNPADFLLPADADAAAAVVEQRVLTYLHGAFLRNARAAAAAPLAPARARIEELIVRNAATAVKQPALYEGQRYAEQLLEILRDAELDAEWTGRFVSRLVAETVAEADAEELASMRTMFALVFGEMRARAATAALGTVEPWIVPAMLLFGADKANAELAMLLVEYNEPKRTAAGAAGGATAVNGAAYEATLWGDLLRVSIMPKQQGARAEYFQVRGGERCLCVG